MKKKYTERLIEIIKEKKNKPIYIPILYEFFPYRKCRNKIKPINLWHIY